MKRRCYIVDIDGTIANLTHRLHHIHTDGKKDWDSFFRHVGQDTPHEHMRTLLFHLNEGQHTALEPHKAVFVYVSGRRESCREDTLAWLFKHAFPNPAALYMRKDGDHKPDDLVKGELLDNLLADNFEPIMAFDDRDRVVEMWRSRGIPCAQVARGDF